MTAEEWQAEGVRRFGADQMTWRFVCPACGHIATPSDWKAAGASSREVAFSCVGRHMDGARKAFGGSGPGPCDYAGGGLFGLNPVEVSLPDGRVLRLFAFADADQLEACR